MKTVKPTRPAHPGPKPSPPATRPSPPPARGRVSEEAEAHHEAPAVIIPEPPPAPPPPAAVHVAAASCPVCGTVMAGNVCAVDGWQVADS